jgi:uncharacterized protein YbjT (DUF2867 family)
LRVLLTGANGFIGAAVLTALRQAGHEVVAVTRRRAAPASPGIDYVRLDLRTAIRPEHWLPHLAGVEAVVNCAGVLQDGAADSVSAAHVDGVGALFAACEQAGVRRVIHLSAVGVDREAPTPFSQSKLAGDEALMARDLDWVILRPSVVVGRRAYGGSALFRGLAALPILPVAAETGPLQIVQLDDLLRTILFFLKPDAPARVVLEVVGPQPLPMTDVVQAYRRWLGWRRAPVLRLPRWLSRAMYRAGDFFGLLGWRPPMRSTAEREIVRGAVGNPIEWTRVTGIQPQPLELALAAEPASVQERWFARMYFVKPLIFVTFSAFWIATGLVSLGPGFKIGKAMMLEGGTSEGFANFSVIAGGLADLLIGLAIAYRPTARYGLYAALAISLFYAVMGTILLPRLWIDPLGPMLKIWPIIALNITALAIVDDR